MLGSGTHTKRVFFKRVGSIVTFSEPSYIEAWNTLSGRDDILPHPGEALGLVMGLHSAPNFRSRDWAKFAPATMPGVSNKAPISAAVQDAIARRGGGYTRQFVEELVTAWRHGGGRDVPPIFILSAPPPYRDHAIIRRAKAPPAVVVEAHRRFNASATQFFTELGVTVIGYPQSVHDDEGFLLPEYREGIDPLDPHHANSRFAGLMLDELERRVAAL
ncbi:hypothetical protein [Hansschlegelia plantiphila]|uniref:Uncharacterized protein n=1 Tax=Hansschlegelia plantiphila TaxID=374655 RepID=A0A9W6IY94_9HYPH|nr:hypothetical protein [Hansschlegelia plantiphila]GLK66381.1 hypothetical protein GCM10008179_00190 [Hansschlegelia plantiphila]